MDAGKHLPRFDNAPCRPVAHLFKRPAPRPVNSRQPKDMHGQPRGHPLLFRQYPQHRPRRLRGGRCCLIHPVPLVIAVDGGCRKIPHPSRPRRTDRRQSRPQERIPIGIGRRRCQDMRGPLQSRGQIGGQDQRFHTLLDQAVGRQGIPDCSNHRPALRHQSGGKRGGRIAISKAKQCLHRRSIAAQPQPCKAVFPRQFQPKPSVIKTSLAKPMPSALDARSYFEKIIP